MDRIFTEYDRYLFASGDHCCLHQKLGSHITEENGVKGTRFAVWAPNARSVSVIGAFNGWNKDAHHLAEESGIWEVFIPGVDHGTLYKYHIVSKNNNHKGDKGDPFAHYWENATNAGTYVWDLDYQWDDKNWMRTRKRRNSLASPISVYEVHLGSWQRVAGESNRFLSYREMACKLVEYVKSMGFTHVEFMPVMAHPFYGSWGYQVVGYFAATCRYGTPQDLMYLIDMFHQNGIGVILDWVPSHFPSDGHGLAYFDGTALYEHPDPRRGFNPEWKSCVFNYGRKEVCSFLMSSAVFWFEEFHIDGMRVDAVSSMLYLDYQRKPGQWIPNQYGGRENLDAIAFLKKLNETIYKRFPSVQMIAEEATSWPMVSRPVFSGGLGFGMKWDMGWMNDSLSYFQKHPNTRKNFHN
ncbi:MAG TPA: 1,4-alpha-glucan branching protein GlgB, partial [Candidatus Omnitrophota bacterium]|nr:1,4-alpha-glucan branching protein GlgB [Candidatus Omnitrophota bacterium]